MELARHHNQIEHHQDRFPKPKGENSSIPFAEPEPLLSELSEHSKRSHECLSLLLLEIGHCGM